MCRGGVEWGEKHLSGMGLAVPPSRPFRRPIMQDQFSPFPSTEFDAATIPRQALVAGLASFQAPTRRRSIGQLTVTAAGYAGLVALMYTSLHVSLWLTLALAVPTAGFVVRLFIIQHDCGHASYFRSHRANE